MTTHPTTPAPASGRASPLRLISTGTTTSTRGPSVLMLLAFVLLVVFTFLGMVWSRTLLDEGAFQLADLQTRIEQETIRNRLLRLEVARLENPDRMASLAEPLGLFYPDEVVHIQVPGVAPREPGFDPPG
ncbi:MAG: hypothetical protein OXI56_05420 [bacterium]|nr:hypothetical protein [bacterium]MDE0601219.1 hypothetical protein [bacterium]